MRTPGGITPRSIPKNTIRLSSVAPQLQLYRSQHLGRTPCRHGAAAPPEISLIDIYRSFGPFICLQLLVLMLVLFFPWLALALL